MDNNISFSKIVATPTLNSWSQAYNAGKLFAVLSLEKKPESPETESLNILGKDLLERLEQEFFAIEEKNLESIKKAISSIFENPTEGINISFAAGVFINNILYLVGLGNAKVFIKREGSLGLALDAVSTASKDVISSSGFLKEKDLIALTTDAFSQVVTHEDLDLGLNNGDPTLIAESLAPKIQKAENGKISAIIIKYQTPQTSQSGSQDDLSEALEERDVLDESVVQEDLSVTQNEETSQAEKPVSFLNKYLVLIKSKLKRPNFKIQPSKKLFLIVTVIIIIILTASVFWGMQEQKQAKVRVLFAQIYPEAQKKYEEGQGLIGLNKTFARESLLSAQKILNDNKDKFNAKSEEAVQTQELLQKINDGLAQVSPIDKSGLDRSKLSIIVANGSGVEGTAGKAAAILKDFGYNVVSTENANNFNYKGVTIKIKKENENFLDLLKKDLAREYTIMPSSSDLAEDYSVSALVIIGK
jgi:hypothetical protein